MPLLSNLLAVTGFVCLTVAGFLVSVALGFAVAGALTVVASRQVAT